MPTTRFVQAIAEIPAPAWNDLLEVSHHPFAAHGWLEALEFAGCVGPGTDWRPRHLTLWRGNELVAAAPAYIKHSSDGDFSRDWGWADAAIRARIPYITRSSSSACRLHPSPDDAFWSGMMKPRRR